MLARFQSAIDVTCIINRGNNLFLVRTRFSCFSDICSLRAPPQGYYKHYQSGQKVLIRLAQLFGYKVAGCDMLAASMESRSAKLYEHGSQNIVEERSS